MGKPETIVTDHGTQFRGKKWKKELWKCDVRTYKTSVYHPNSDPAERVLREVGRILQTYCHHEHSEWSQHLEPAETFLNWAYHETIGTGPYQVMFEKPPPRKIISLVNFPPGERVEYNKMKMHNRLLHEAELLYKKETGKKKRINPYKVGDKVANKK